MFKKSRPADSVGKNINVGNITGMYGNERRNTINTNNNLFNLQNQTPQSALYNKASILAFVIGIVSLLVGFIPLIGWFFAPLWPVGIILGVIGLKGHFRKLAIWGIILVALTVGLKLIFWLFVGSIGLSVFY
ncbi:hypothetical protein J2S74_003009 [Evansella vedderi]|uniref:DUF4190 domain-containing protein n=1 Tax=Evansella vedderi TaxID=38282 RepID=A0ABT9ZY28_9BACI|nr:hypothetical protein [Evansella vedderi]MDQ0255627.1 hypothetical protein [Evansella vedderi]